MTKLIFDPTGKDEFKMSHIESIKNALGTRHTSISLFMIACDSIQKKGVIESIDVLEKEEGQIFDFVEA
jgi:hypothetical protein